MQENNSNNQKQNSSASSHGGLSWSAPAANPTTSQKPMTPNTPVSSSNNVLSSPNSAKYIGMIIVGVVAGIIIAWGYNTFRYPTNITVSEVDKNTTNTNLGVDTNSVPTLPSDPSLTVASPQSSGRSVAIAKAIVSVPTWIVVYDNKDGIPGNALGAALFFPEMQTGTVELLRATIAGKTYLVAKRVDNGDRKFSLKDDQLLIEGGEVQWVQFEVK